MKQKYILLNYPGNINQVMLNLNARDNCNEPYILLRERCRELGYLIEPVGNQALQDCAWLVFWNAWNITGFSGIKGFVKRLRYGFHGKARNLIREARRARMTDRLVLVLGEPPSVYPEQWNTILYNQFSTILTWNDDLVDGNKFNKYYPPVPVNVPRVERVDFRRKKLLVNISMNKFSIYPHELYSARRDAIRYFEKARPNEFDLYGVGWDNPRVDVRNKWHLPNFNYKSTPYTSYRGMVKHKWEIFPRYKFALCYENVSDQPGWITEKIFDAMRADCVPIYWGAPNVTDYVDPAAFIDRREFQSNQELEDYITGMNENQYEQFREAIATYLASERFKAFLSPAFVQRLIQVLGLKYSD